MTGVAQPYCQTTPRVMWHPDICRNLFLLQGVYATEQERADDQRPRHWGRLIASWRNALSKTGSPPLLGQSTSKRSIIKKISHQKGQSSKRAFSPVSLLNRTEITKHLTLSLRAVLHFWCCSLEESSWYNRHGRLGVKKKIPSMLPFFLFSSFLPRTPSRKGQADQRSWFGELCLT